MHEFNQLQRLNKADAKACMKKPYKWLMWHSEESSRAESWLVAALIANKVNESFRASQRSCKVSRENKEEKY